MKKNIIIIILIAIGVAAVFILKNKNTNAKNEVNHASQRDNVNQKTATAVNQPRHSQGKQKMLKLPRVLDLGADKCMACKAMEPVLEKLREEYKGKLQVDFIDVWKNPDEAKKYNIRSIPTQIFFDKNGKEISRHTGFISEEDILKKFNHIKSIRTQKKRKKNNNAESVAQWVEQALQA